MMKLWKNKKAASNQYEFFGGSSIKLQNAALHEEKLVFAMLETSSEGISAQTAKDRLHKYGKNEVATDKAPSWMKQLAAAFINPFIFILLIITGISFLLDVILAKSGEEEYMTVLVVTVMVVISGLLRFSQEYRSNQAAEKLKAFIRSSCAVKRKFEDIKEIDIQLIVPGDIISLSAGDMIPADCRLLFSKDLFISESMLTGEALPVEKNYLAIRDADKQNLLDLNNICFMGTNVVSGTATAVVVHTGNHTYFASISKQLARSPVETAFDKGVNQVSMLLIRFMLVMVPVIFLLNGLIKGDWMQALLFAVAIAVGLTPEMLPMIVTGNLAKGALNMSKHKVIIRRLNAIQNIGAMDVLCTDKTGTLTLDKIVLEKHLNIYGKEDDEVLKWSYLNSFHQTGLKNLLDKAILDHVELHDYLKVEEDFIKVDEIPFDFQRRRMSVILKQQDGRHLLICKGAVEELLDLCTHTFEPGENRSVHREKDTIEALDAVRKAEILEIAERMNADGLRVLLVAIREFEGNHALNYHIGDESNLIFTGFIGFLDPAKPSAAPSIEALQKLGVQVKVLTGDNEIVTRKICKDVGIPVQHVVNGMELEKWTEQELLDRVQEVSVFAKLSPIQKSRVIQALRKKGHTVGFMGDGINDAIALKDADVGISVDTAVDIAKESADVILLEKDLMVLRKGLIYGRRTFGNITKYIQMTTSSNFGNMFSMLGASIFLPFLPMLPVHLLIQNLLYDISQTTIPWDSIDKEFLEKPKNWEPSNIKRFMLYIGPISSIYDFIAFAVLFFVFKANSPEHQTLFQTGWFIEGLLSQTLIIHMIRTRKIPFIQSWATAPVVAMTSLIMLIGILIPFTPWAAAIKMQAMPLAYFPWLIGILAAYCITTQFVKNWYIKKFQTWI